jgi:16S rRNA processing protein RimM
LTGEVYVMAISDDPARFTAGSVLERSSGAVLVVEGARPHRTRLLVKFAGVDDRDSAEALRGPVFVRSSDLRDLEEEQWWEHELVGLTAVDLSGTSLGRVTEVMTGAAQDLLVLETPRGERLVPLVAAMVQTVDTRAGRIVLDPPEGLFD